MTNLDNALASQIHLTDHDTYVCKLRLDNPKKVINLGERDTMLEACQLMGLGKKTAIQMGLINSRERLAYDPEEQEFLESTAKKNALAAHAVLTEAAKIGREN